MADPDPPGPPSGGLCREIETTLYYYYYLVVLSGASHLGPAPFRPRHLGPHGSPLGGGLAPPSTPNLTTPG